MTLWPFKSPESAWLPKSPLRSRLCHHHAMAWAQAVVTRRVNGRSMDRTSFDHSVTPISIESQQLHNSFTLFTHVTYVAFWGPNQNDPGASPPATADFFDSHDAMEALGGSRDARLPPFETSAGKSNSFVNKEENIWSRILALMTLKLSFVGSRWDGLKTWFKAPTFWGRIGVAHLRATRIQLWLCKLEGWGICHWGWPIAGCPFLGSTLTSQTPRTSWTTRSWRWNENWTHGASRINQTTSPVRKKNLVHTHKGLKDVALARAATKCMFRLAWAVSYRCPSTAGATTCSSA